jgi:hypothetical protein
MVAETNHIRPTLLSGDVHLAAVGAVESRRNGSGGTTDAVVNQLISSGIVHPGPGGMILFALRHLMDSVDEIDRGIIARMTKFPGTSTAFVGGRNYLSLEPISRAVFGQIGSSRTRFNPLLRLFIQSGRVQPDHPPI